MRRKSIAKRISKRLFTRTAMRTHKKNLPTRGIMRGGMRF